MNENKLRQFLVSTTIPLANDVTRMIASSGAKIARADFDTKEVTFNFRSVVACVRTINDACIVLDTDGLMTYTDMNFDRLYSFIVERAKSIAENNFGPIFKATGLFPAHSIGETRDDWTHAAISIDERIQDMATRMIQDEGDFQLPESIEGTELGDSNIQPVDGLEQIGENAHQGTFKVRLERTQFIINMMNVRSISSKEGITSDGQKSNLVRLLCDGGRVLDTFGTPGKLLRVLAPSCMIFSDHENVMEVTGE